MNQTPEVPAGTRCQCPKTNHTSAPSSLDRSCYADAVRMVWVRKATREAILAEMRGYDPQRWQVPMCAACAEYHTAKAGAR